MNATITYNYENDPSDDEPLFDDNHSGDSENSDFKEIAHAMLDDFLSGVTKASHDGFNIFKIEVFPPINW